MIPNEVIEDIKSKADIVQVISNYINVIKKGNSYVAVCPFHDDKNPSLNISQNKQIYKCFSCGAGGNVFTFVSNFEKIPFADAIRKVAQLINYESPLLTKVERKVDNKTKNALTALMDAKNFYSYVLNTNAGLKGKQYFIDRNISEEMISYFDLGFSPENGELTIKQLRAKNNTVDALQDAGILINENSNFSDRFKGRIIFPIYNEYSEVIGFSARRIDDSLDSSKYVNSPSTILFNKSSVLYNYQNAKKEAKSANYCYIVEGFMDVFSLYRCGIKSCVAIMGTAFTKSHAKMLKKLNVELRLCLDGDTAGQKGIANMCAILDNENIQYKIVNYDNDLRDPDEIYNQDGKDKLLTILNNLTDKLNFLLKYYANSYDILTAEGKKQFIEALAPYYFTIKGEFDREVLLTEMSSRLLISQNAILSHLNSLSHIYKKNDNIITTDKMDYNFQYIPKSKQTNTKIQRLQRNLMFYMINSEEACEYIQSTQMVTFVEDMYLLLANYVEELKSYNIPISVSSLINTIQANNGNQKLINELTEISLDNSLINECDIELVQECLDSIQKVVSDNNFREEYYANTFEIDEIKRAEMLDKRKKGVN